MNAKIVKWLMTNWGYTGERAKEVIHERRDDIKAWRDGGWNAEQIADKIVSKGRKLSTEAF